MRLHILMNNEKLNARKINQPATKATGNSPRWASGVTETFQPSLKWPGWAGQSLVWTADKEFRSHRVWTRMWHIRLQVATSGAKHAPSKNGVLWCRVATVSNDRYLKSFLSISLARGSAAVMIDWPNVTASSQRGLGLKPEELQKSKCVLGFIPVIYYSIVLCVGVPGTLLRIRLV